MLHAISHFDPFDAIHIHVDVPSVERYYQYVLNRACPNVIPETWETWEAYKRGFIKWDVLNGNATAHGVQPFDKEGAEMPYHQILKARSEFIHAEEFIQWARRQRPEWTNTQIAYELHTKYGFIVQDQANKAVELYDQLPTISDHLHWLQRNVDDAAYVQDFGLLDGFSNDAFIRSLGPWPNYTTQTDTGGRDFWGAFGHDLYAQGVLPRYAAYQYAAHWINPAPGQLAEMVCRLRPGKPGVTASFTAKDYLRILAEQDISPYFRERFLEILYRTLPLRQLNQATQQGQLTEQELAERFQDICFSPSDSKLLARTLTISATRTHVSAAKGYTPAIVSKLVQKGLIDFPTATDKLGPQGFSIDDVRTLFEVANLTAAEQKADKYDDKALRDYAALTLKAYGDGVVQPSAAMQALMNVGYSQNGATLELQTVDLRVKMDAIDNARKAIRRSFLTGELSSGDALTALGVAGVLPNAAANYVGQWQLQFTVRRKAATRAQINRWATDGLISIQNAAARLANLGYSQDTINFDLAEIALTIRKAQQLAAQRQAAALARANAAIAKAQKAVKRQYCKLYTPGKVKLWYSERIWDQNTFYTELAKCDYSQVQIDTMFKEAEVARAKKDEQAASKGPTGIEYTGPGADSG
jgi:hypothetical protein